VNMVVRVPKTSALHAKRQLQEPCKMKKTVAAILAIASIAGSLVSITPPAQARDGAAVGAGIAAGLIGGAIVGGAIANSRPAYGEPAYVAGPPGPPPGGCYYRRERYWDGYGWVIRPVRYCY
jgi:hypothetical protein